jgi:hypothetical protein
VLYYIFSNVEAAGFRGLDRPGKVEKDSLIDTGIISREEGKDMGEDLWLISRELLKMRAVDREAEWGTILSKSKWLYVVS